MAGKTSFRQFGIRTLLLIVALAALGCLLIRNEMAREERREKLIAELEEQGTTWQFFQAKGPLSLRPPRLWREPTAAWLRGKPMVQPRAWASFGKGMPIDQLREFLDLFPTLRGLEIDGKDATPEVLTLIASRGPYEQLSFRNPVTIDKEMARQIAQIKCKSGVCFNEQEASDLALISLADARVNVEIYSADDYWRKVSDEGLKAAATLSKIKSAYANCRGTDEGVRAWAGHPSVIAFYLRGHNYTDASADVIPTLPVLSRLHIAGTSHSDAGLAKAIANCNAMTIELEKVTIGDQTMAALATAPKLIRLSLRDVELSLEQYDALAKLPLSHLEIASKTLTDDHLSQLAPLGTSLTYLHLDTPQVTDQGLAWLSRANRLAGLQLDNTQATAVTWSSLPPAAILQAAGVGGANVDAETFAAVSKLTSIRYVTLAGSQMDDATLELLPQGLSAITLVDTQVTPIGVRNLAMRRGVTAIAICRNGDAPFVITADDVKAIRAATGNRVEISRVDLMPPPCE